jgi:3-phytase
MQYLNKINLSFYLLPLLFACQSSSQVSQEQANEPVETTAIEPLFVTEPTRHDTDDPAVWINFEDPSASLILGTDKDQDGAIYVYDLEGKIIEEKVVRDLQRPNNVDVEYGLMLDGKPTDIAVATERFTHRLRIFSLPDMLPIDGGGIPVFEGETGPEYRDLMGIALYRRPDDGAIFAIVGRKNGPTDGTYLWQYLLEDKGSGQVKSELVRKFGKFSGQKEIEAIAVDDSLGYVYYSDETAGVRQYHADPEAGNDELAIFATEGFAADREGISIFYEDDGGGYILVSDQDAGQFHVYARMNEQGDPTQHPLLAVLPLSTQSSDGSEIVSHPLPPHFPEGLFVAMSEDKTFQLYPWQDLYKLIKK